ncbi:hypothetical protein E4U42_005062 [Claviceps africana]|uniref:Spray n=1 Tax=Claviceps africana TaxID=83212 RepID=A0A8K0J4C9_9HYPO|nr:hypothetical protein E4U42_005062 [Claviceps africana]
METYDQADTEPWGRTGPPDRYDHQRPWSVSASSNGPMYYEESPGIYHSAAGASLVSLQSTREAVRPRVLEMDGTGHIANYSGASQWTASFGHGYRGGGAIGGYVPVADMPIPRRHFPESIQEEEYDLALLQSAKPMGVATSPPNRYEAAPEDDETTTPAAFDITSTIGLVGSYDSELLRSLQQQEARGTLTGGLGQGDHPASTLRDTELLTSPSPLPGGLTRSFTRRSFSTKPLSKRQTIQYKGQDEANRRGQVIEVILETAPTEDLSNFEGSRMVSEPESRRRRSSQAQKSAIFYPQPNWKPWSMRWPYLAMVILLSLALGGMQEVLIRKYKDVPLLRFQKPAEVTPGLYFAVKFAPTLSAVVYGVLWQFIDFEVRRLEAYYQLSKPGGALAAESINVDYVTSFSFYRPLRALRLGHHAVALSSIATTLAISLVPTFASASVILTPNRDERMRHPSEDKFIYFSPAWSRLLTSTLAVCAACGFGLLFLLQTRRTGLVSDVQGIAGLASMAVVSHILMDFKDMDTAKHKDIHQKLKHNRYVLQNSSLAPADDDAATSQERRGRGSKLRARDDGDDDDGDKVYLSENPHPLMLRPAGFVPFIIVLFGFTGFVPAFLFTKGDVVTEKAPWVVTAVAVCLKMSWNALETAVRMMEPFYILSRRHAPSMTLTLDYTALPFGYLPLRALLNGQTIMFLVGMGSVMAEFLTILVTGLATVDGKDFLLVSSDGQADEDKGKLINAGQETIQSFYVSFGIAVFILTYMGVVSCLVFVRRRHPFLPRQPTTISSVLAYIHQSKMLYAFVGADAPRRLLDGRDASTYGLGWFQGRDGQMHCGVDREELTSSYQHGVDVKRRNQPWNMQWDVL